MYWALFYENQVSHFISDIYIYIYIYIYMSTWNDIWNGSYMNYGYEIKWSYDPHSYERNFCNCIEKPEPVTLRYRCNALTNWAMKPLTLGAGHLWVLMLPWRMNQHEMIYDPFDFNVSGFIVQLVRALHRYCEVTGFKPWWSPEFFRLLYAIAKIVFMTARIIASLDIDMYIYVYFFFVFIHM